MDDIEKPFHLVVIFVLCLFMTIGIAQCNGTKPEPNTTTWSLSE